MYRFQVTCNTSWGEEVCMVGSAACLGAWDVSKAVPLKPEFYPVWKSDAIDVSRAAALEYKYIKRSAQGCEWEHGKNRWVPVEADAHLTVHDGNFGEVQPEPFSFPEYDDRPKLHDPTPGRMRIVVIGSSVAEGFNAWRKQGWAWLLTDALEKMYGHEVINVSQSGANTQVTKERFREAVCPWCPDVVIVGLSLGNEGLAHCEPQERESAQHRFEQGLLDLVRMIVDIGAVPVLGGVYPNNDYTAETYKMVLETAGTMSRWGIPVFEWLPSLDAGNGKWKDGVWFDHAHPNTKGHRLMFECIDLKLFDPKNRRLASWDLPSDMRRRESLEEFDKMERKPSRSHLDPSLQESYKATDANIRSLVPPIFDDGAGFSIVLCRGALSIRNKTEFAYVIGGDWKALDMALKTQGLRPGAYIVGDAADACGPATAQVLLVDMHGRIANQMSISAGADVLLLPVVAPGAGRDR